MRTKTFTSITEGGLDSKVNNFISTCEREGIEIIEVQFTGGTFYIGAMVIYKKKPVNSY